MIVVGPKRHNDIKMSIEDDSPFDHITEASDLSIVKRVAMVIREFSGIQSTDYDVLGQLLETKLAAVQEEAMRTMVRSEVPKYGADLVEHYARAVADLVHKQAIEQRFPFLKQACSQLPLAKLLRIAEIHLHAQDTTAYDDNGSVSNHRSDSLALSETFSASPRVAEAAAAPQLFGGPLPSASPWRGASNEAITDTGEASEGVTFAEAIYLKSYSRCPEQYGSALLNDEKLQECRQGLTDRGFQCKLQCGAMVFVSPEQYPAILHKIFQADLDLRPWHLIVSEKYEAAVDKTVASLPKKLRIKMKDSSILDVGFGASAAGASTSGEHVEDGDAGSFPFERQTIIEKNTFIQYPSHWDKSSIYSGPYSEARTASTGFLTAKPAQLPRRYAKRTITITKDDIIIEDH